MQWMNIFATNDSFPLLYKLISIVFSMPVSVWNVCSPCSPCGACVLPFVERVFSLVSAQWSKERNSLSEKTVKSILQAVMESSTQLPSTCTAKNFEYEY